MFDTIKTVLRDAATDSDYREQAQAGTLSGLSEDDKLILRNIDWNELDGYLLTNQLESVAAGGRYRPSLGRLGRRVPPQLTDVQIDSGAVGALRTLGSRLNNGKSCDGGCCTWGSAIK